jgi:hypothetical protein
MTATWECVSGGQLPFTVSQETVEIDSEFYLVFAGKGVKEFFSFQVSPWKT